MRLKTSLQLGVAFAALGAACSSETDPSLQDCFTIEDCPGNEICFMANCVDPGYSIQNVHAELTPPADTPYLTQQTREPLQLTGYQSLSLHGSVTLSGDVLAPGGAMAGTLVARATGNIPGRPLVRQASVTTSGFVLKVIPDTYDIEFIPTTVNHPTDARPPVSYGSIPILSSTDEVLPYPADGELVELHGTVRYSSSVSTGVADALVSATGVVNGQPVRSSIASTALDGSYRIVMHKDAQSIELLVRPGENPYVPEIAVTRTRGGAGNDELGVLELGVDDPDIRVGATVEDENGLAVPDASIMFEGLIGSGAVQGRFLAMAFTNSSGTVVTSEGQEVALLQGTYRATVVPLKAQRYALRSTGLGTLSTDQTVAPLTVGDKIEISGRLKNHLGQAVKNAHVVFTLRQMALPTPSEFGDEPPSPREYTATTDSSGDYSVLVDPGEGGDDAVYEVIVEPEVTSGLPMRRDFLLVGSGNLDHDITLYTPSFVYGRVHSPGGSPLTGVLLAFYSLELGGPDSPLLVGVAQSTTGGEFVVPLPTPD
jgi:hypothetical protein